MDKNVMYVSTFGVLCVLAGVLVGAGIAKKSDLPWPPDPGRPHFAERAQHFMGCPLGGPGDRKGGSGPLEMLSEKLGLSAEQKTKIAEILEKTRQEIEEIGKNVRTSIDEVRKKGDKQIMDILDPQQQVKFKELQDEFKKGRGMKGPRGEYGPMHEDMPRPDEGFPLPPRE